MEKDGEEDENQISNQTLFEKFVDYDQKGKESKEMCEENSDDEVYVESEEERENTYRLRKKKSKEIKSAQYYISVAEEKAKENMELEMSSCKAERRTILDENGRYLTRSRVDKSEIKEISSNGRSMRKQSLGGKSKVKKQGKNLRRTRSSSKGRYYKTRVVKNGKTRRRRTQKARMKGTKDYNHEKQNLKIRQIKEKAVYESEIQRALAVLQENALPKRILCRDVEKSTMRNFISEGIEEQGCSQCLCKESISYY